jgi:glycerol-3-phosphate acyltransferase PlsY
VTTLLAILLLSYLLGSIPTAIIVGRLKAGIDIRRHGSGNAGATNVYRVLGLGPAVIVILVDVGKGLAAVLLATRIELGPPALLSPLLLQLLAGGAAVVGHVWTVFAGFRGGKGVGTTIGALAAVAPKAVAIALVVWIVLLVTVRIMSVASLSAALTLPLVSWLWQTRPDGSTSIELVLFTSVIALFIFFTHRSNIGRLLKGEEPRLGRGGSLERTGDGGGVTDSGSGGER